MHDIYKPEEGATPQQTSAPDWHKTVRPKTIAVGLGITLVLMLVLSGLSSLTKLMTGVEQGESFKSMSMTDSVSRSPQYEMSYDVGGASNTSRPAPSGGTGSYDEVAYEARQYTIAYKTGDFEEVTAAIEAYKPNLAVVFEQATHNDTYAQYRFKVAREHVDTVLATLEELGPTGLTEQTEVVKKQLMRYAGELEILEQQEALLLSTLTDVNAAYNELVTLSKDTGDVETLATVINDKLKYVQDLSQRRIQVAAQIERIAQRKAELMDRIEYVYFTVTVMKYQFIDGDDLKDDWVAGVRGVVYDMSTTLQWLTFGLMQLFLLLLVLAVYGAVLLFIGKHGWRLVRAYWQR